MTITPIAALLREHQLLDALADDQIERLAGCAHN